MPHRANRTFVTNSDALTAWAPIARARLLEAAATYRATVSEQELAERVQEVSGIRADQPADLWIGKLLERVAKEAERRDEPPLASLCLTPDDSDARSRERLRCYQAYATDLPADGGSAAPVVRASLPRRRTAAPAARAERRPVVPANQMREVTCTSCFMIVPARDVCTSCGEPLPAA